MYSILGHTAFEDLVMEARIICTVSSDTLTSRIL